MLVVVLVKSNQHMYQKRNIEKSYFVKNQKQLKQFVAVMLDIPIEKIDGNVYFCTDTGNIYIDCIKENLLERV